MSVTTIPLKNGRVEGKKTTAQPPRIMDSAPEPVSPEQQERLDNLLRRFGDLRDEDLLRVMIETEFRGKIAAVSSFGAESAVLLHMVAQVDPTVPVLFLNTGKLFGETLRYRDRLQDVLGLTDLRSLHPHPRDERERDPHGGLWNTDPDACCYLRKVQPLERGLHGFEAQITGRKRFQTAARAVMPVIEVAQGRFKINPLADWDLDRLNTYMDEHKLPRHPLVKDGYLSIGCMPCTDRVKDGEDYRSGRWSGLEKDECGIHGPALTDGDGI